MKTNLLKTVGALALAASTTLCGCVSQTESSSYTKEDYALQMNVDFPSCDDLPDGNGKAAKVFLLLGQSNASGCSIVEYLQLNTDEATFAKYEAGFENVKINYCIDNQYVSSDGEFVPVDLTCGCGNGFFGPEVGMAEVLSEAFAEEDVFILKYTMSGYSLGNHWLYDGERAWIYDACMTFVETYMNALTAKNYRASLDAICWMQGESDTNERCAAAYYDNQTKFIAYLREDLAAYADGEIYFIDAGISSSPYCLPGYPQVNQSKKEIAELSPYNVYFSTIDMGLTTLYEPDYNPDLGHYDSLSEIALGQKFGEALVNIYKKEN
ncbi:MAG: hypothetical protein J6A24_06190 [Clostridia bacterium]|nr:hypothetical protein [Clostridia bacterium]